MSVAKQLYQLQELDQEIEASERKLEQLLTQLEDDRTVANARAKLDSAQQHLDDLKRQQRTAEGEIDDFTSKLSPDEEKLYSGRVQSPKELANLQQEVESLKAKRSHLEDKALEIMEQVEAANQSVVSLSQEVKEVETNWQHHQQQLSTELEQVKTRLDKLKQTRQAQVEQIETNAVMVYQGIRAHKGKAVTEVKQGICNGCRISLPSTDLQQAKGGKLVQCSSCGRILFLA
jgi:predicted  nucleic acid-binding Zn-ribbon protein